MPYGLTPLRLLGGGVLLAIVVAIGFLVMSNNALRADARASAAALQLEADRREQDRLNYEQAQREAAEQETERLAAMAAVQEQNHDDSLSRFDARLADLDRELGGVRVEVVAPPAGGPGHHLPGSPLSDATGSAVEAAGPAYAPCDRECLASLIQLDELITYVETTAATWPTNGVPPDDADPR